MGKIILILVLHKIVTLPMVYDLFIKIFYRKVGLSMDQGDIHPHKDELYGNCLSPIEATLGLLSLKRVENIIRRRGEIGQQYLQGLREVKGLGLPVLPPHTSCSWMRFPIRILNQERNEFYLRCLRKGLDLGFTYTYSCSEECPKSLLAASQVTNLPMNSSLTDSEVMKIIRTTKEAIQTE
jgi:dTDP-4-amino-4,6-dideoxygalactose transaminase